MARTGDKEGEGKEAQEGSSRLVLRSQSPHPSVRPSLLPFFFSQHVASTSHARNLWFSFFAGLTSHLF